MPGSPEDQRARGGPAGGTPLRLQVGKGGRINSPFAWGCTGLSTPSFTPPGVHSGSSMHGAPSGVKRRQFQPPAALRPARKASTVRSARLGCREVQANGVSKSRDWGSLLMDRGAGWRPGRQSPGHRKPASHPRLYFRVGETTGPGQVHSLPKDPQLGRAAGGLSWGRGGVSLEQLPSSKCWWPSRWGACRPCARSTARTWAPRGPGVWWGDSAFTLQEAESCRAGQGGSPGERWQPLDLLPGLSLPHSMSCRRRDSPLPAGKHTHSLQNRKALSWSPLASDSLDLRLNPRFLHPCFCRCFLTSKKKCPAGSHKT